MLPKPRARAGRRLGWPFSRRRNRRVRANAPPDEPRPSLIGDAWDAIARWRRTILTAGVGMMLAAGVWAGRWYVTHARHFRVASVRVSPLQHVTAEALVARAGVPLGVNLFAVDRDQVARNVSQEPWVARAHVRLELPSTIVIDAVERQAVCIVALGALYLADADGVVFKRATPEEAAALPVVTGIARDGYVTDPDHARADVRSALAAAASWSARADRGKLGELHVDRVAGLTLYTEKGMGVRLGVVDDELTARLRRLDAVLEALDKTGESARLVYVDNRARPDRVTVKLASVQKPAHSANRD